MSDKVAATRARQACEPCRRKKTKCPGERPVCSFCQRLGQRCTYEKSNDAAARVQKSQRSDSHDVAAPKDRLQRLESRVEEVFDILSSFAGSANTTNPSTLPLQDGRATTRPSTRNASSTVDDSRSPAPDENLYPEQSEEKWQSLIDIYKKRFDHQPLPLLSHQTLAAPPETWSKSLLHSFLSLTLPFHIDDNAHVGPAEDLVVFYADSARHEIMRSIADGEVSVDLLQAACLSALKEITNSNSLGAWMIIGTSIRLALSTRFMSNGRDTTIVADVETRSRCCWSLFILDRIYGSTLTVPPALSTESILPDFPTSTPRPEASVNSQVQTASVKDMGVLAYYLQLLSIWGETMKYVEDVKNGQSENAWILRSQYHQIMARLFDYETKFAQVHRFQQARIQDYDIGALEQQRNYWAPWLSTQFLFHAIQGLINHPFLHIASRLRSPTFQPPSFLQNSVDQAVLHSSWILKCIEVCSETSFKHFDPFLAHLAAVTATIYLFLLNSKDEEMAIQSKLGFDKCYNFVQSMGNDWPHLLHTVEKLNILQREANTTSNMPANPSAPKAQRSLLWELLDYSASTNPSKVPEFASDAVDLNVDTRFLSPINPLSTGQTPATAIQQVSGQDAQASISQMVDDSLWNPSNESLGFNLFDNEQMADLTNLTFGRDFWSFGQL